jgi:hypothetical protein
VPKIVDIIGQRFGMLTVVHRADHDNHGRWRWVCKCDCGVSAIIASNNLRSGNSKSCGCQKANGLKSVRVRNSGSKHYRWVSDRSLVEKWRDGRILKWRKQVLAANHYRCMKCGSAENLHVHHADSWDKNRSRRFDPLNGVPLCASHHREFHKLHGRDSVTQEQLHEYLNYPAIERDVIETKLERPANYRLAAIFDLIVAGDLEKAREYIDQEIKRLSP